MSNDFLPFGTAGTPNVLSQGDYVVLATRGSGFLSGIAKSEEFNKVWRQSSVLTSQIAQFLADELGANVLDDGNLAALLVQIKAAIASKPAFANSTDVAKGDALMAVLTAITGAVATTQHQVNNERTSVFQTCTSTQIAAILAETGLAAAECSVAFQSAMDGLHNIRLHKGVHLIAVPLRVKNGTLRTSITGEHRIRGIIIPNATNISGGTAHGKNTIFIIQDNNAHFCIDNIRFTSVLGFTGVGIYCEENGGTDSSAQCMFSGVFTRLWIDFPTTNNGFLRGGMQNCEFRTATCENMKGIFRLSGAGSGDNYVEAYSLYNCYDQLFLQTDDAFGTFNMTVRDIHAYNHQRGQLFDVSNWKGFTVDGIHLEPDAANLGGTGLYKWTDCVDGVVSNGTAVTRAGVPACAIGIDLVASAGNVLRMKFVNERINADVGLRMAGTGTYDLEFNNCDFTDCTTACWQIIAACLGVVRTRNCKFNRSQQSCILATSANALSWYSDNDEFYGSGLGGSAGTWVITLATSGLVVLNNPRIGRGAGASSYFIDAGGSGSVVINNPTWLDAPGTWYLSGAQAVTVNLSKASKILVTTTATQTVTDDLGCVVADRAGTVTLTLPNAATHWGVELDVVTQQAQTVVSASSNVIPKVGGAAGTALLPATAGAWTKIKSTGVAWRIINSGV